MPEFLLPFGPFHMVMLHLPIGALTAIWFLEILLENKGDKHKNQAIGLLHLLLLLSCGLTIALGLSYEEFGQYGDEIEEHEFWGYIFGGCVVATYLFYWINRTIGKHASKLLYMLSLLAATIAMVITGHQGGELIHGKGFLTKPFKEEKRRAVSVTPAPLVDENIRNNGDQTPTTTQPITVSSEASTSLTTDSIADDLLTESIAPEVDIMNGKALPTNSSLPSQLSTNSSSLSSPPSGLSSPTSSLSSPTSSLSSPTSSLNSPTSGLSSPTSSLSPPTSSLSSPTSSLSSPTVALFESSQAIFKRHCYKCHGATKQKGDYRLDSKHSINEGGKSKLAAVVPGDPEDSELMYRMLLPRDDDDVMPPEEKDPVSAEDIDIVRQWIEAGAYWPDQAELNTAPGDYVKIGDADTDQLIDRISSTGVKAEYNAWADESIRIDLGVVEPGQLNQAIEQLNAFGNKLTWLDCSELELPEDFLNQIQKLKNLERLHLDGSNVTDEQLKQLSQLPKLSYLNLYNTQISDTGLTALKNCVNLKKVFLSRTAVTPDGIAKLKKALPELEIVYHES